MDTALIALLVSAGTGAAIALVNWWLSRSGRQLLTRKDLREEASQLWTRVGEQDKLTLLWKERYEKIEAQFDERERTHKVEIEEMQRRHGSEMADMQRKHQLLLAKVQTLEADSHKTGG